MTDFSEVFDICKNVPKDASSEDETFSFYISEGSHEKSINFFYSTGRILDNIECMCEM